MNKNIIAGIGVVLYGATSLIDKYLVTIDDIIYLPIVAVSIIFILVGILKRDK